MRKPKYPEYNMWFGGELLNVTVGRAGLVHWILKHQASVAQIRGRIIDYESAALQRFLPLVFASYNAASADFINFSILLWDSSLLVATPTLTVT